MNKRSYEFQLTRNEKLLKAAILVKQNSPLVVSTIEKPELSVGQILVKVFYSGICGKQLEEINGKRGADPYLPHLLGHEGSGVVEKVGPGVTKVSKGEHVVLHWIKGTGINADPPRFKLKDKTISAGWVTTFSDYTIVSENRVTPIPSDVPLDVAALLGCSVTTGLGIVYNNANLKPGQSIAVFGVGGVGLNVIQGASLINSYPIVAIDIHQDKLDWATNFGASHTINTKIESPIVKLNDLSQNLGFDAAVDLTGNKNIRQITYDSTANSGTTIFAGVPNVDETISIDSFPLHFGRKLLGSHGGDTIPDTDIPRYISLFKLGKLKLKEQITHRFSLDNINDAIDVVKMGQSIRCVISMHEE